MTQKSAGHGHIGVDVFFVLSGFLITTLLLERADEPLRRFYVRRGLRLLPALYVLLIVVTLIVALREPAETDDYLRADFFAVTYLTNWAMAFNWFYAPYLSHLWTLAVEEQFYIVFPVLLYFAMRHWRNRALQIVLTVAVLSLLWRSVLAVRGADQDFIDSAGLHLDTLLAGSALALARFNGMTFPRWARWWPVALAVLAVTAIVSSSEHARLHSLIGVPIVEIAAVTLVLGAVTYSPRVFNLRPMVVLGIYSYSLYLWHVPLIYIIADTHALRAIRVPLAVISVVAATYLSHRFVERPFLRLKDRGKPIAVRDRERPAGSDVTLRPALTRERLREGMLNFSVMFCAVGIGLAVVLLRSG